MNERSIFMAALEHDTPDDLSIYLNEVCADDPALRKRVEALLRSHEQAGEFLRMPAPERLAEQLAQAERQSDTQSVAQQLTVEQPVLTVGPYKLIQQIGEGGMGEVWLAEQSEPVKRTVALKLIKAGMDSRQVIARFEAERQALALMDHPNIARVLDGGTTRGEPGGVSPGRPYFVMDLVKGVPITRYCDEHHLTLRQRLELFLPVCQAVQHAHQKGIIHRDLKPSNILVAQYDGKAVPKVIDFGVAKAAGQTLTDKTLVTGFGAIVGTLEYMSPEQAEINQLDIDTRSDIYSLGVLLYELLTGSPPFTRKELTQADLLEMLRLIREQEPTKPSMKLSTAQGLPALAANRGTEPSRLTALVRGELDWIVMKALEKDRNHRYETANAFALDVQRYLADEPVEASAPSKWYRLRKFIRRSRQRIVTALLLVGILLAVSGSIARVSWDRAARRSHVQHQVELHLQEARTAREQALRLIDNREQWHATLVVARSALKRAEELEAREQLTMRPEVQGEMQKLRTLLDADDIDRQFVDRLDLIRFQQTDFDIRTGQFNLAVAFPAVKEAFRVYYGIDFVDTPAEAVVTFIHQRPMPIQEHLLEALEISSAHVPKEDGLTRQWLTVVLKGADVDPWGQKARACLEARNWPALEKLVTEASKAGQRPAFVLRLVEHFPWDALNRRELFRSIQRAFPGDYWVNYSLARVLHHGTNAQYVEALRYYGVAIALRPKVPVTYLNLGDALQRIGDLDGAIEAYREAVTLAEGYAEARKQLDKVVATRARLMAAVSAERIPLPEPPPPLRRIVTMQRYLATTPEYWSALGAAHYRAGNPRAAIAALEYVVFYPNLGGCKVSLPLTGGTGLDWFYLAMAQWQVGRKVDAHRTFNQAVAWMDKNAPNYPELVTLKAEAARLLKVEPKKD